MTKKRLILAALFALAFGSASKARAESALIDGTVFSDTTLAYSTSPVFDVSRITQLSMQSTASSASISSFSLDDGRKATGTITVASTSSLTSYMIGVGGCSFINGREWTGVSTTSGTAQAIADAIQNSVCLAGSIVAARGSGTSAVVYATATAIGTAGNSIPLTSSGSSITVSGATLSNGDDSNFSVANDDVTTTNAHGITTGFALLFSTVSASTPPTGLTNQTTYYAIVSTTGTTPAVRFRLASSSANALAGTPINITAITGGGTFTLAPTAFAGTYSWKWQASNDRLNFADLSVSSVTYSVPVTTLWGSGLTSYKYLRLAFTAGTGGGMNIKIVGYGLGRDN